MFSVQQQQITPNQMPQPMVVKQEYPKPEYSYGNLEERAQEDYGVQVIRTNKKITYELSNCTN